MALARRSVLCLSYVALGSGFAGCIGINSPESETSTSPPTESQLQGDCVQYVYHSNGQDEDGALPEDLYIRRINLSRIPVSISITDLSENPPEEIVSCTVSSESSTQTGAKFVFGLSPDTRYRVEVSLESRDATATTEITGDLHSNEALEVTVDDGELRVRKVHYDSAEPSSE